MALTLSDILGTEQIAFTGTSLSTNCTVPSGCGAILVFHARYTSGGTASVSSFTLGGNSPNDSVSATASDETCAFGWLFPGLSSGSRAVSASGSTGSSVSNLVLVYLSTDVDPTAFKAKNALASGPSAGSTKSFTLSGLATGDLVLQFNSKDNDGSSVPGTPSGWTSQATQTPFSSAEQGHRTSAIIATGTTQACAAQALLSWATLTGVALQEVSGGGSTGTMAVTGGNDTSSASGTTTVLGTLSRTAGNDTSSASGTTTIVGTFSRTAANDTMSAAGEIGSAVSGTFAVTAVGDSMSAVGSPVVSGSMARTAGNDTMSASGSSGSAVSGSMGATGQGDNMSAAGSPTLVGTGAAVGGNDLSAFSGTTTILGALARTAGGDTMSASGTSGTPPAGGIGERTKVGAGT